MCRNGSLPVGEPLPRMRELSDRFGVSQRIVNEAIRTLMEEGLLYAVPRVGTFVGRPPMASAKPYLFLSRNSHENHMFVAQMQNGFEDRIAQLKGSSASFTLAETLRHLQHGEMISVSGAFFCELPLAEDLSAFSHGPTVTFGPVTPSRTPTDFVDFDDEDGGAQATRHLLEVGHRHIAFLGLHGSKEDAGQFPWSVQREAGWRHVMESAGYRTQGLSFCPLVSNYSSAQAQIQSAQVAAKKLLPSPQITAIIAVNAFASHGLVQMLREANIPIERWPAIVCFDETPRTRAAGMSYLRLPWEKIGAEAAQMLWERTTGRLTGPPKRRLVKMHLIPRLTCRPDWAQGTSPLQRRMVEMSAWNYQSKLPESAGI